MPGGINLQSEWMCFQDTIKHLQWEDPSSSLFPRVAPSSSDWAMATKCFGICGPKHFSCPSSWGSRKKSFPPNDLFSFKLHILLFWLDRNNLISPVSEWWYQSKFPSLQSFTFLLRMLQYPVKSLNSGDNQSHDSQPWEKQLCGSTRWQDHSKNETRKLNLTPGHESRLNLVFNLFIIPELKIPQ